MRRTWALVKLIVTAMAVISLAFASSPAGAAAPGPAAIPGAPTVTALGLSSGVSCAVVSGGLHCWGSSLNDPTGWVRPLPTVVSGLASGVAQVAVGNSHLCVLTSAGGVECRGSNTFGQIGNGLSGDYYADPQPVFASGFTGIASGAYHTCALGTGEVWCWGHNDSGQAGDPDLSSVHTPEMVSGLNGGAVAIAAGFDHTCALMNGGGVKCWGGNSQGQLGDGTTTMGYLPVDVIGVANAKAIAAGFEYTCALLQAGNVKCWGAQADVSGVTSHIIAIAAGYDHSCLLAESGSVECWGSNDYGQLGDGTTASRTAPVSVQGLAGSAAAIAAGAQSTCALLADGQVQCWGSNTVGQLADGSGPEQFISPGVSNDGPFTALAADCAITTAGGVVCWGNNVNGILGAGFNILGSSTPVPITSLASGVTAISSSYGHACALAGGQAWCWGNDDSGQIGDGGPHTTRFSPMLVTALGSDVLAVAAGGSSTCALVGLDAAHRAVKCWGANYSGQLGDGTNQASDTPVTVQGLPGDVVALAPGGDHYCVLSSAGGVRCWGANFFGQLGDGLYDNSNVAVQVSGLESGVKTIAAGPGNTCAILQSGALWCWGRNDFGELGIGSLDPSQSPVPLPVAGLGSGVMAVAFGNYHTCAALADGSVHCFGGNGFGQLGNGITTESDVPVTVIGVSGVTALAAGTEHTCALSGGSLRCWGQNGGYLGDGTVLYRATPRTIPGLGATPELATNYPDGQKGSVFRFMGIGFTPDAEVTLRANGTVLGSLAADDRGNFIFNLRTRTAVVGSYTIEAEAGGQSTSAGFTLAAVGALRIQEGAARTFRVSTATIFLPMITKN